MRFAYIDSQGNEVSIPSVDALGLRIELGAIGPDTELYDAQADRWGPAQTHEIFHTLSRDLGGEGGFVAPPPPVATPAEPEAKPAEVTAPQAKPPEAAPRESKPRAKPAPPPEQEEAPLHPAGGASAEAEEALSAPPPPAASADFAHDLGMDLTLADEEGPAAGMGAKGAEADDDADEEDFDFGGFGSLEVASGAGIVDRSEPKAGTAGPDSHPVEQEFGGGMDMEQPMSEFTPDTPPAWTQQDEEEDAGVPDLPPGGDRGDFYGPPAPVGTSPIEVGLPAASTERPEPRSRPSPPRRTKQSSSMGVVLGIVFVAVVGGGGYFAWINFFGGGRGNAPDVPAVVALPPAVIPEIPAELEPVMQDLGAAALVDMIDDLIGKQAEFNLAAEPRNDWLAGVYLANASDFRDLEEYWEALERYLDMVRDTDAQVFHEKFAGQLELAEIAGAPSAVLLERADSGFQATRDARFEAYNLMDDLVNAALDLHQFLLDNEDSIDFAPASGGVSRDPVLEAVPATSELGDEMWGMVDRITEALDRLGTLDRVTTERLTTVLFDRIRQAGFR